MQSAQRKSVVLRGVTGPNSFGSFVVRELAKQKQHFNRIAVYHDTSRPIDERKKALLTSYLELGIDVVQYDGYTDPGPFSGFDCVLPFLGNHALKLQPTIFELAMIRPPPTSMESFTNASIRVANANSAFSDLDQTISIAAELQLCTRPNVRKTISKTPRLDRNSKVVIQHSNYNSTADWAQRKRQDKKWTRSPIESLTGGYSLVRCPTNSLDCLAAQFVAFLQDMHFTSCFYSLVPSHLGYNDTVDRAARAAVQAYQGGPSNAVVQLPNKDYIKAVEDLRNSLDASDSSLMVIMLLTMFERIVNEEPKIIIAHLQGLTALLHSRSSTSGISDAEGKLIDSKNLSHWIPLMTNQTSPFESSRWLDFHAVACSNALSPPVSRLARLGYQLQVRLPRLVKYVRSLKECDGDASVDDTIALAQWMTTLEDSQAENEILHHIRIESTKDIVDKVIVPCSLKFNSLDEFDAATGVLARPSLAWKAMFGSLSLASDPQLKGRF